ncbi:MAG TPA: MBL fold metallo-hydrolase [Chloroflexota bacterium]|nr:MBL fold metallo-hydrolase [Chloroflexota bacterium]
MRIRFWGTRGSIPSPGPRTVRYGGNCACVEVRTAAGELFIVDAGTGIRELGLSLADQQVSGHLLLSHTHWDHISGFPFFPPAFVKGNTITVCAARNIDRRLEDVMSGQMEYTYFPVKLDQMSATIEFRELVEESFAVGDVRISTHYLNHTSICLGYRIEADGCSVAYVSDHEPYGLSLYGPNPPPVQIGRGLRDGVVHDGDRQLIEWVRGVDLLIQDSQYTPEEYPKKIGWGHGSADYVTDVAILGGAKRLALFHHDPLHDDDFVDGIVSYSRQRAAESESPLDVTGAAEGQSIDL